MHFWRGNTSSIALSPVRNLPNLIENFLIVNKDGNNVIINITIENTGESIHIAKLNLSLNSGDIYYSDQKIVLKRGDQIKISTNHEVDYYFNISDLSA